jgi:integrase
VAKIYERLNRKKTEATFWLDYTYEGKRIRRSTGLAVNAANRKKLENEVIPRLEAKIRLGDLTRPESRKFSHYYGKYLLRQEKNKSFKQKRYVYEKVNAHFAKKDVAAITQLQIEDYLLQLCIAVESQRPYLSCVKGVMALALKDRMIGVNPAVGIELKNNDKKAPDPFTAEEMAKLLEHADGMLLNYLGIAFYTGMRPGEILGLMRSDIKSDRIEVKRGIYKGAITTPKTPGSIRDVPILDVARPFIEAQLEASQGLYLFDVRGGPILRGIDHFEKQWPRLVEKAGVRYRKIYSTRHTFITEMIKSGKISIPDLAKIAGHKNTRMITEHYLGLDKAAHENVDRSISFGTPAAHTKNENC